jgi:drug/metabolite transporter (DMT)-like permease
MIRLLATGLLAGMFFSSTFVLNRAMSLEGGCWVWSASLRYAYMILVLSACLPLLQGRRKALALLKHFYRFRYFWILAGSVGFGGFYALGCYAADHAPAWVIATTWQSTIVASLFVLCFFGQRFPRRIWFFSLLVFSGVAIVNLSRLAVVDWKALALGGLPVLLAAFCYPFGNQLVWEAENGHRLLPDIRDPLLHNPFNKVLLMSLGSVPFWILLLLATVPPPPGQGQLVKTAMVALFSGVLATSLFLHARKGARTAGELAAVDATQSSEVVFAVAGEILFLGAPVPSGTALAGVLVVFAGLGLFLRFQKAGE